MAVPFGQVVDMGKGNDGHAAIGRNLYTLTDCPGNDNLDTIALQYIFVQVQVDSHVAVEAEEHHGKLHFEGVG